MQRFCSVVLVFLCFITTVYGSVDRFSDRVNGSMGSPLVVNSSTVEVYDDKYYEMGVNPLWSASFENYSVRNYAQVGFLKDAQLTGDYSGDVTLDLEYHVWNGTTGAFDIVNETRVLSLFYSYSNPEASIIDKETYIFELGHYVKVKLVGVTGNLPLSKLYLESGIEVDRYYPIPSGFVSNVGANALPTGFGFNSPENEFIDLNWGYLPGADWYELEYVHINDYTTTENIYLGSSVIPYDFYKNSTRVSLSRNYYRIPNIYDHGYFIYRVRAISLGGVNHDERVEGAWDVVESGMISSVPSTNRIAITREYDKGMNWMHQVGFTEEGKRFEGVTYADGLGRARQSQAMNTETDQTVVTNVYMDELGRPVISSLPTPVDESYPRHLTKFNKTAFDDVSEFGYPYFDNPTGSNAPCLYDELGMSLITGTGQYYSSQNPDMDGSNGMIPNANGMPYSRVTYKEDFTGRVDKLSGVGSELSLSSGHSSRMVYLSPIQEELNMLFGSDAGDASHYQKIVTIDGNGQAYVTYQDLAGRTVATWMIGPAPLNLDELDGTASAIGTQTLMSDGSSQIPDYSIPSATLTKTIIIPETDDFTLVYGFTPEEYTNVTCLGEPICFDCKYTFEARMVDECGVEVFHEFHDVLQGSVIDAGCTGGDYAWSTLLTDLPKGVYTISKTLKVDQSAIEEYWCLYLENVNATCITPLDVTFNSLYNQEDFAECKEDIYFSTAGLEGCELNEAMMKNDLTPGGQYAMYSVNSGVYSCAYPASIFYPGAPGSQPYYTTYNFGSITVEDPNNPGIQVSPATLSMKDFILLFDASWSDALLVHHPEYCLLEYCYSNNASHAYDNAMRATFTFYEAQAAGYFKPVSGSLLASGNTPLFGNELQGSSYENTSNFDPFFASGAAGYSYVSSLKGKMQSYIQLNGGTFSIWDYAVIQMMADVDPSFATALDTIQGHLIRAEIGKFDMTCYLDLIWINYRKMYLDLKADFYRQAQDAYAASNSACAQNPLCGTVSCASVLDEIGMGTGSYGEKFPIFPSQAYIDEFIGDNFAVFGAGTTDFTDPGSQPAAENLLDAAMQEGCDVACTNYAQEWLSRLSGCDDVVLTETQETNILDAFKQLCMSGCDTYHPGGASTPGPGFVYTDPVGGQHSGWTIDDILGYFGFSEDMLCTELLISQPAPYENMNVLLASLTAPLDDCSCDKLQAARVAVANNEYDYIEVALAAQTGISLEDANYLICECDNAIVGGDLTTGHTWTQTEINTLAATNLEVPSELACLDSDACLDCSEIQGHLSTLLDNFGFTDAIYFDLRGRYAAFSEEQTASSILTNYMNNTLNFNMSYQDYHDFIMSCMADEDHPYCTENPLFDDVRDVLKLLSYKGQLTNSTDLDLMAGNNNIVYSSSDLYDEGIGNLFTSSVQGGTTLSMDFEMGSTSTLSLSLDLPAIPGFDFNDILYFGDIYALTSECSGNNTFEVEAYYLSCGILTKGILTGNSGTFEINECVCDPTGLILCNDPFGGSDWDEKCYEPELSNMYTLAMELYQAEIDAEHDEFVAEYNAKCSEAFATEDMALTGPFRDYQFTLFYYDQAGNLVKTVAPKGVALDQDNHQAMNQARNNATSPYTTQVGVFPINDEGTPTTADDHSHVYRTEYVYNSYNQLVSTTNPDQDGETKFWYDRYGRIAVSQNPVQLGEGKYSYIIYDTPGRPIEVGQVSGVSAPSELVLKSDNLGQGIKNWIYSGTRTEVTRTYYDRVVDVSIHTKFKSGSQKNLRLRVASVLYYATLPTPQNWFGYESAVHYSYDIHGNVIEQVQDVPSLKPVDQDMKSTEYEFELISGNVKKVTFERGDADQLIHEYEYDALNRLTETYVSVDDVHKDRQVHYRYYDYGPLSRVEYGEYQVQGQDYFYTINGWMKGMNASTLGEARDAGKDGTNGYLTDNNQVHNLFARDVTAYTLGYYQKDYNAINGSILEIDYGSSVFDTEARDLYNGNIRSLVTSIVDMEVLGKTFQYDQLNRLKQMRAYEYDTQLPYTWDNVSPTQAYFNSYKYDRNGNITELVRHGHDAANYEMDRFNYNYDEQLSPEEFAANKTWNNRLSYVEDIGADDGHASYSLAGDIRAGQGTDNYQYDRLGQLIVDEQEGHVLEWRTGDKKLAKITIDGTQVITFKYNPFGQRIIKRDDDGSTVKTTYYAYDANGQVMAVYKVEENINKVTLLEQHLYGSSRVGMRTPATVIFDDGSTPTPWEEIEELSHEVGLSYYEMTNYLGNVEAVITDRKVVANIGSGISIFEAVVVSTADYYPFGMAMPDRQTNSGNYRYGYNGMELDNEVSGNGNSYTTEFRQYDPRLGRWKSLDQLRII